MEKPGTTEFLLGITRVEDSAEVSNRVGSRARERLLRAAREVRECAFRPGVEDEQLSEWGGLLENALYNIEEPELSTDSAEEISNRLDEIKQEADDTLANR